MRLSPEIYTDYLAASEAFYVTHLGFRAVQRDEGFVVLRQADDRGDELMLCSAASPFVNKLFHPAFSGHGMILQLESADVPGLYERMPKDCIALNLVDEPGNGLHFTVRDPNGVLIDIVVNQRRV